jgi:5'-methylthioadenosine phosphorylase
MTAWRLGIIGGSGLYDIDALEDRRWTRIASPWGEASDEVLTGVLNGVELAFLPRHGRGHMIPPSAINARANIDVLKRVGCTDIVSVSAVGSLREDLPPGALVLADQYIDRTRQRPSSFFGAGLVAHVSMADPVCPRLSAFVQSAGDRTGAEIKPRATYLAMEGPQFSTRAESRLYRSWGCDVIGMTAMPEARLAREAELPYAALCMVTDYDCWREDNADVDVASILAVMHANVARARKILAELTAVLSGVPRSPSPIDNCLDMALITDPAKWDPDLVQKLDAICARRFAKA